MWSVGCIFGELMLMKALFPGKNEKDQLDKIFKVSSKNVRVFIALKKKAAFYIYYILLFLFRIGLGHAEREDLARL